ncbi:MAG: hypothetical protein Q4G68_12490 [Planctomycetia bacterium]|nr:hypothetical protein [Planctomycetia bacterium]
MKNVKILLRRVILSCLVWAAWSCLAWGQGTVISPELMKEITEGHARLKEYTQTVSGKIVRETMSADDEQTVLSSTRLNFYCQPDSTRLEYFFPREDANTLPRHDYGSITNGFHHDLEILYTPGGLEITDKLEKEIESVENISYEGVGNAICITSKKVASRSLTEYEWKMILNPEEHYSLMYYETRYDHNNNDYPLHTVSVTKVTSQTIESGEILPCEIIRSDKINGEERYTQRTRIEITSTKE